MRGRYGTSGIILVSTLFLSACTSSTASPKATPTRIPTIAPGSFSAGLVTDIGRLNDRSYNQLAYTGLKVAASKWGIHYRVVESHAENDYVRNLTAFANSHVGLIVAVGFSMRSAVYQVASSHPTARFAIVDAAPLNPSGQPTNLNNVANLFFKEQESGYLVGVIAGLMEKQRVGNARHGGIGYLGGTSIPAVTNYFAGYVAGAHQVYPGVKIHGDVAHTYSDMSVGGKIGQRQIAEGADILFQVAATTGIGYLAAAQRDHRYGIGADANQGYLDPSVITSAVKRVDVAVELTVRSVLDGSFAGGDHRYGLREGATGFAPPARIVPPAIASTAVAYAKNIAQGKIVPPESIPRY